MWQLHTAAAMHPRSAGLVNRRFGPAALVAATEVLIDGFPRSANTFTVAAFQLCQPTPVRVAHHLHSAGTIVSACRRRIPVLVLIREPPAPIFSTLRFSPHLDLEQVTRAYIRFYERLLPWRESMVVLPFDIAVSRPHVGFAALNDRFGTSFGAAPLNAERVDYANRLIDESSRRRDGDWPVRAFFSGVLGLPELEEKLSIQPSSQEDVSHRVARPVPRPATGDDVQRRWESLAGLRHRAARAYEVFAPLHPTKSYSEVAPE